MFGRAAKLSSLIRPRATAAAPFTAAAAVARRAFAAKAKVSPAPTAAAATKKAEKKGLVQRLKEGPVICAEGYLFEMERRGYVQIGAFVPEVVLDRPEAVEMLHREFLNAGSDVIEAFTYYAHREKMKLVGKEHLLEKINRDALKIATKVAAEGNALVAGNICNTTIYEPNKPDVDRQVMAMFKEQVKWAVEAKVDLIIGETFDDFREAKMALDAIVPTGIPAVITLAIHQTGLTREGHTPAQACKLLAEAGATVVGLNCSRGPATMLPMLKEIKAALPADKYLAALPVPFHTTDAKPTFQSLCDKDKMYSQLDHHTCTRYHMADFAVDAVRAGVSYLGVCCGGAPHHVRAMAEAIGRKPAASRFSADLSKHFTFGNHPSFKTHNTEYAKHF